MRTTMDLPEDLLAEAMRVTHVRTKISAVTLGLKELIHRHQLESLRALRGRIELAVDLRKSRRR